MTNTPEAKTPAENNANLRHGHYEIPIENAEKQKGTAVDRYWGQHLVHSQRFKNARESLDYLEWRFDVYPMFRKLMDLWGQHDDQVVLDYGCGPGNDLVGFLVYTKARQVIGVDVSEKALREARERLALHQLNPQRIRLIKKSDSDPVIPLGDQSVDYLYSEGVLHHTSNPQAILSEFYRILKPGGQSGIMVYNYNSLFVHLYIAYDIMVLQKAHPGLSLEQAFTSNTDGADCPISRYYAPEEFITMCQDAGFQAEFAGGYLSKNELDLFHKLGIQPIFDERLPESQRLFLRALTLDQNDYPLYQGKYAGIGGVYQLYKEP